MTDGRNGIEAQHAQEHLCALLGASTGNVAEHENGGWSVHLRQIERTAIELLPQNDEDNFRFVFIEIEHDEYETAWYVETIMHCRPPRQESPGIIVEGLWRRQMKSSLIDGEFEGRVVYACLREWNERLEEMEASFAKRSLNEYLPQVHYAATGLQYILRLLNGRPISNEAIAATVENVGRLNRAVLDVAGQ